jgi:tetratricopeptide (TPR) repeat protein
MVDELTKKIKAKFKLSDEKISGDIDKRIGEITTSSPEAYKFYREGVKHGDRGDYRREIQCFENAIAIDPEFAKAYLDMGIAYYNLRLFSEEKKYIKKALELSDRVSDRERYLAEAYFYTTSESTFDKAIEAFKKLLELYPEDEQGNADLGWVYMQLEQRDEAIKRYEVLVQNKTETMNAYTNLASLYRAKELYDKANFVLESYIKNFSDNVGIHQSIATNYIHQGKLDLALAETDKAFLLDPTHYGNFMRKGDICLYRGDLIEAEKEYQDLLKAR